MKGVDLHNGIRRALNGASNASTPCARCQRTSMARRQLYSLPIRTFSSTSQRRADAEPPKEATVSSKRRIPVEELRAAPEIEGLDDEAPKKDLTPASPSQGVRSLGIDRGGISSSPPSRRPQRQADGQRLPEGLRVIPASPSYFTAQPNFFDHYLEISSLFRRHMLLPHSKQSELAKADRTKITWLSINEYKELAGEKNVSSGGYMKLIKMCQHLSKISPRLMPMEVSEALQRFMKEEQPVIKLRKPVTIDSSGRAYGLGKRKSATARAWIVKATGETGRGNVLINGKTLSEYFSRIHQRQSAIYALSVTNRVGEYNVWGLVEGGGNTGQAEAMTLAVANALRVYEPHLAARLKSAGCLARDRRVVERKKPGHLKARKKPAWVKR